MLRYLFGIAFLLSLSFNSLSAQTSERDILGTWKAWDNLLLIYENDNGIVEGIYVDENGKQSQKEKVVRNLKYTDGIWEGDLYSKKRNKSSKIECHFKSPEEIIVKLKITRFFSKSFSWEKVHTNL